MINSNLWLRKYQLRDLWCMGRPLGGIREWMNEWANEQMLSFLRVLLSQIYFASSDYVVEVALCQSSKTWSSVHLCCFLAENSWTSIWTPSTSVSSFVERKPSSCNVHRIWLHVSGNESAVLICGIPARELESSWEEAWALLLFFTMARQEVIFQRSFADMYWSMFNDKYVFTCSIGNRKYTSLRDCI